MRAPIPINHDPSESYLYPELIDGEHARRLARLCIAERCPIALIPAGDGWQIMSPPRVGQKVIDLIKRTKE